jgi:hypothetical protein
MARLLIGGGALLLAMTLFPRRCGDPAQVRRAGRRITWRG